MRPWMYRVLAVVPAGLAVSMGGMALGWWRETLRLIADPGHGTMPMWPATLGMGIATTAVAVAMVAGAVMCLSGGPRR